MADLILSIEKNTLEARNIAALAEAEHISPEEAALKLLASWPQARPPKTTPKACRIIGLFSAPEEAALMDDVMELVMSERQHRNAEPPRKAL